MEQDIIDLMDYYLLIKLYKDMPPLNKYYCHKVLKYFNLESIYV